MSNLNTFTMYENVSSEVRILTDVYFTKEDIYSLNDLKLQLWAEGNLEAAAYVRQYEKELQDKLFSSVTDVLK